MSDEDVIRRRLMIDGDGTGDDRRLNVILKLVSKWAHQTDESPAENQALYDRILAQLSQCEFSVKRSQLLTKSNAKQLSKYQELQQQFEEEIAKTKVAINESKENLSKAKTWKHHQMMYDIMAQSINEQPARKQTTHMLQNLHSELNRLHVEGRQLEEKLDMRRKQFHVLISSANQLRVLLEEANVENKSENNSFDDITNSPGPEPMSE